MELSSLESCLAVRYEARLSAYLAQLDINNLLLDTLGYWATQVILHSIVVQSLMQFHIQFDLLATTLKWSP